MSRHVVCHDYRDIPTTELVNDGPIHVVILYCHHTINNGMVEYIAAILLILLSRVIQSVRKTIIFA